MLGRRHCRYHRPRQGLPVAGKEALPPWLNKLQIDLAPVERTSAMARATSIPIVLYYTHVHSPVARLLASRADISQGELSVHVARGAIETNIRDVEIRGEVWGQEREPATIRWRKKFFRWLTARVISCFSRFHVPTCVPRVHLSPCNWFQVPPWRSRNVVLRLDERRAPVLLQGFVCVP